jgi:hypothetical protein
MTENNFRVLAFQWLFRCWSESPHNCQYLYIVDLLGIKSIPETSIIRFGEHASEYDQGEMQQE